jgi:tetratricopeptide (TPR) repeat protein
MELQQIIGRVLSGGLPLDELEAWVEANRSRYRKPPLREALHGPGSRGDVDRLVDEYSDWEIRMRELSRYLSEMNKIVYDRGQSDRTLPVAKMVYALSKLYEATLPRAKCAFVLGYALWQAGEYYDAAEALAEATELYRRSGGEPLMEVTALSYRCDCLYQNKQFDETISCAADLRERARLHGFRGHEALALRDLGMAHSALGRESESLESLRDAVRIRRSLSDEEVREQSVIPLAAFLHELGLAARTFGRFDEAVKSFLENREFHRDEGEYHFEALALSEVGYTYQHGGDFSKAAEYLRRAIRLEEQEGTTPAARRWKLQLSKMGGGAIRNFGDGETRSTPVLEEEGHVLDTEINDANAYLIAERALGLAQRGDYENATQLAASVLRWATAERDVHCQIVCRNVLGICYDHMGHPKEAVSEFQNAIKLADGGGGGASASLTLRYNLAKVYLTQGEHQNCADVLRSGIAYSQMVLTRSDSFAFRQQVVSGALPLYELFALLLSHADAAANHENLLAITEVVRARNMATWARIRAQFESESVPKAVADRIDERLRQLRAVEVELDLRHLAGALTSSQAEVLQSRTETLQAEVEDMAVEHGVQIPSAKSRRSWEPFREMDEALAAVMSPGTAVLSLFSIPEGICPSIFYRGEDGVETAGSIIEWDRDERIKALSRWTGEAAFLRSRSATPRALGEVGVAAGAGLAAGSLEHSLDEFLNLAQERLFDELVPLLGRFRPRRLAIIPHRELALIPYWRLADRCDSIDGMTLIPSLNLLRICVGRSRDLSGRTVAVPDVTGTLPKTHRELEAIRGARKSAVEHVTSVEQLLEVGPACNLLHVAAHGAFNPNNPYHSGYLMDSSEPPAGLFVQYVRLMQSGGQRFFRFSDTPQAGCFRLMTVAECMARLSLKECRLAVLSACECGLADPHGGGELTGLPTSLLVAGAKSVIAALWPVDDAATAVLMDRFYRNWAGGTGQHLSPAYSLALARGDLQRMEREEILNLLGPDTCLPNGDRPFAHPLYSDAFQCYGDW